MRQIASIIGLVLILAACGTTAQVEPQQTGITIEMVEPTNECHVEAEATDNAVLLTASEGCVPHSTIPFRIVEVDGPQVLHDGGVYAKEEPNPTVWPATHVGTFEIRHRQTDALIGTITVPSR